MDQVPSREELQRGDTFYYSLWGRELQAKVYMNRREYGASSATIIIRRKLDPVMVFTFSVRSGDRYLTCEEWALTILAQVSSLYNRKSGVVPSNEDDWLTPDPW